MVKFFLGYMLLVAGLGSVSLLLPPMLTGDAPIETHAIAFFIGGIISLLAGMRLLSLFFAKEDRKKEPQLRLFE